MLLSLLLLLPVEPFVNAQTPQEWLTTISSSSESTFNYFWADCVGSGHGALALRSDYHQQIKYVHDHIGISSVRFHGILDDDVGSVNGVNDYSFVNIDKIIDYLQSINMKPYFEVSYTPDDFASGTTTTHHYKSNVTPPKDWNVWYSFIQTLAKHLVDKYGINEVSTWKFEVWNEPNCGNFFNDGPGCNCSYTEKFSDYMGLYSNTSKAIKSVNQKLNVGGPATAQLCWIDRFLNVTESQSIPVDFVSSHLYPTDREVDASEGVNAFFNKLKSAGNILKRHGNKYKLYLSEFNSGLYHKNNIVMNHDNNIASSFMVFNALKLQPLITDYNYGWLSYWAFSDVFEEQGFNSNPFHNGFGMQTIRGIGKPVLRALQLLHDLGSNISYNTTRIDKNNDNGTVQVYVLKNANGNKRYTMYIANWNLLSQKIEDETLSIEIQNGIDNDVPKSAIGYKIDANNSNPINTWNSMGSPTYPNEQQLQALNKSSQYVTEIIRFKNVNSNTISLNVTVPQYGVVVIDFQY